MKWLIALLFLLLQLHKIDAQKIQIFVPKQPVVAGNAFQVQYVITDPFNIINTSSPVFDSLVLISGPNYYKGNAVIDGKMQPIENITYTLVCPKPGRVKINGIIASFKNSANQKSNDTFITVEPQANVSFNTKSNYTDVSLYAPASKTDLEKLIAENLFIKTEVNRTSCFVGESIVASFKLYSRLQSSSEVINAPGLYGFSVIDMININEAHTAVETINGKVFNTSVLRKLQMYPEQIGKLIIDEMQLQNEIEFEGSTGKGKTKVEKELTSPKITIEVKPLPVKKPADFTGAVGKFYINAQLQKNKISDNEQGKIVITISGEGNFIQFGQPVVQWPKGFDVFDPFITDVINKTVAPTEGKRIYEFGFTVDSVKEYILPSVSFSFFDPVSGSFKTIATNSLKLEITKTVKNLIKKDNPVSARSIPYLWIIIIMIIAIIGLFIFKTIERRISLKIKTIIIKELQPGFVQRLSGLDVDVLTVKQICFEIKKLISEVLKRHKEITHYQRQELEAIGNECEMIIYSDVETEDRKEELKNKTLRVFKEIENDHSAYL